MAVNLAIAYDGSPSAATAVRVSGALFGGAQAAIVTVPAPPPAGARHASRWLINMPSGSFESAIAALEDEAIAEASALTAQGVEEARAAGLDPVATVLRPHSPTWEALLKVEADLLVCGARGRSELARTVLGSTSISLLHHSERPLLIVPDDLGAGAGPILIAYDGSEASDRAIDVVGTLLPGAEATLVHVWESQYRRSRAVHTLARKAAVGELITSLDAALAEQAASVAEAGLERATAAGLKATSERVEAESGVWRTIAAFARERDAALVVTGREGSALLGSVSSGLVHNAHAPVLVVPAPASP